MHTPPGSSPTSICRGMEWGGAGREGAERKEVRGAICSGFMNGLQHGQARQASASRQAHEAQAEAALDAAWLLHSCAASHPCCQFTPLTR